MIPEIKVPSAIALQKINTFQLSNGIPLYYINSSHLEVIEIQFVFDAGAWFQKKALQARLSAGLIFDGLNNKSSKEISEFFDYYGTFFSAQADKDYATVTLYATVDKLKEVMLLFEEVIKAPVYPQSEIDKALKQLKQEHQVNLEKNAYLARVNFQNRLFGNDHPYGKMLSVNDFEKISREDLLSYYNNFFRPDNCKLFISGKVDDSVLNLMNNHFGTNWDVKGNLMKETKYEVNSEVSSCYIEKSEALQSAIRIGGVTIDRNHEDFNNLQIVNTILGGYFGSRLMKNIREDKGYTYGIGSGLVALKNASYFTINTEVKASVTQQAIDEIYKEIDLLKAEYVSEKEINLVRNYLIGELYRSVDGPFNLMEKWKGLILNGFDHQKFDKLFKVLNDITPEIIKEISNRYYDTNNMLELIVGKNK